MRASLGFSIGVYVGFCVSFYSSFASYIIGSVHCELLEGNWVEVGREICLDIHILEHRIFYFFLLFQFSLFK